MNPNPYYRRHRNTFTKREDIELYRDSAGSWRLRVTNGAEIGYYLYTPSLWRIRRAIRKYERLNAVVSVVK